MHNTSHSILCLYLCMAAGLKSEVGKDTEESPLSSPKENKIRAFVVFFVNVRQNLQNSLHWFDL